MNQEWHRPTWAEVTAAAKAAAGVAPALASNTDVARNNGSQQLIQNGVDNNRVPPAPTLTPLPAPVQALINEDQEALAAQLRFSEARVRTLERERAALQRRLDTPPPPPPRPVVPEVIDPKPRRINLKD